MPKPHCPQMQRARRLPLDGGAPPEALARVLPLWPVDLADRSIEGRRRLIAKLDRALKAERRRARARSHAYDLARHIQLARAYRDEEKALHELLSREPRRCLP